MKKYELFLILSTAFLSVSCTDSFFDLAGFLASP